MHPVIYGPVPVQVGTGKNWSGIVNLTGKLMGRQRDSQYHGSRINLSEPALESGDASRVGDRTQIIKNPRKLANELIMVCLVMVGLLLVWNASQRIANFNDRQLELAEHSVKAAASEVGLFIKGYERAVRIFAEENNFFLNTLELWPQDMESYSLLQKKIDRYFPEHLTFTLADSSGRTLLEGFEGLVGERCRNDIRSFSSGGDAHSIHSHHGLAGQQPHFDVMSYWEGSNSGRAVFFISFKMNSLERILANTQVPGHQLLLVPRDMPEQIDATPHGNRATLPAGGRLGADERQRISHSLPVTGTGWNVEILPNNSLASQAHRSILMQTLFVFAGFIIVSVIMRMILLDETG